jgi:hypothetical protein
MSTAPEVTCPQTGLQLEEFLSDASPLTWLDQNYESTGTASSVDPLRRYDDAYEQARDLASDGDIELINSGVFLSMLNSGTVGIQ